MTFTCPSDCFCWAVIQNCRKHLLEDGARCRSSPWWLEVWLSPAENVVCVSCSLGWGWAGFNGIMCLRWCVNAPGGVVNFSQLPRASAWLRLMRGLRVPLPVWQQEEVCGIIRNGQISWPISTSWFKTVKMDRSEPPKAEAGPAQTWFIYAEALLFGLTGRPAVPVKPPHWSALIKCGKRLIPTDIDCVVFFFFFLWHWKYSEERQFPSQRRCEAFGM